MTAENEDSHFRNAFSVHKSVRILILGDCGIGKTSLVETYLGTVDAPQETLDIFEMYHVRMNYNETNVDMGLIDLYHGPTSPERRECYPTDVDVILLCFSIGHLTTLKSIYNLWIHEVRAHFGNLIPIFLVGLRGDLRFIQPLLSGFPLNHRLKYRLVEKYMAEIIHKNYNFQGDYMECSMYDEDSVIDVIQNAFLVAMEKSTSI